MYSYCKCYLLLLAVVLSQGLYHGTSDYTRSDFPHTFIFGSGTSAYQVEGAANEDGRTPSIWDTFAQAGYAHGYSGDVTCDQYHKYQEDVQLMVEIGLDAYRFSISWTRLIPNGRGPVNLKAIQYYNNLIDELLSHGIQPHVTLVNYDHPQALEDEYNGWISRKMVNDFVAYANVCFREFGDRVKYWTTMNEPNVFAQGGYDAGITPPSRCSYPFGHVNCTRGNSSTEPYTIVHHILLAHASAVRLYRQKYQDKQHGFIGLTIYTVWYAPQSDAKEDIIATQRAYDFLFGWVLDPLVFGDYPKIMKRIVGSRIPSFTKLDSEMVMGSFDFIGIIHFTGGTIKDNSVSLMTKQRDYFQDQAVELITDSGIIAGIEVPVYPEGLEIVLDYLKRVYGNPPIFIYENGLRTLRNSSLEDSNRVDYIKAYIGGVLNALRNGSNTRGYFTWSFMDAFELFDGFDSGYGLFYVDFDDPDLKRFPRLSAHWYSQFLKGKIIDLHEVTESQDKLLY